MKQERMPRLRVMQKNYKNVIIEERNFYDPTLIINYTNDGIAQRSFAAWQHNGLARTIINTTVLWIVIARFSTYIFLSPFLLFFLFRRTSETTLLYYVWKDVLLRSFFSHDNFRLRLPTYRKSALSLTASRGRTKMMFLSDEFAFICDFRCKWRGCCKNLSTRVK